MGEIKFMDLLFSKYASPLDLINTYIDNGRFGEFVTKFLELENERRREKQEHDEDWQLWVMYTRLYPTYTQDTFIKWKAGLQTVPEKQAGSSRGGSSDADLTEEDIQNIINNVFSG